MPPTRLDVEPPNSWSVVFLQRGLGFPVRTGLGLSYSESSRRGTTALISDEGWEHLLTTAWLGEAHEVLVFHLGSRGNGFADGIKEGVRVLHKEGWALEKAKSMVLN